MHHIRNANLCAGGSREWFKKYGIDWSGFLSEGVPVEVIEATGDELGFRVAAIARQEAADGK